MTKFLHTAKNIVQNGDPVLRQIAQPLPREEFGTKKLALILREMAIAVEECEDGVAIAAPQIGISLRIFIVSRRAFSVDEDQKEKGKGGKNKKEKPVRTKDLICINPEITKLSKKRVVVPEGCLSVRYMYGNTLRSDKATIRAYDAQGKMFTYHGSGIVAQIFQHETDHLNGTLFIDHATDIEEIPPEKMHVEKNSKP